MSTNGDRKRELQSQELPYQAELRKFFAEFWVELAVGGLVIVSVVLTLFEFIVASSLEFAATTDSTIDENPLLATLSTVNNLITCVFVVELSCRFYAARRKLRFFREFWLDIIAVLPVFRIFRVARALRLLRLVRMFRLLGLMPRLATRFPYVFRRGLVEYLFVCGLLVMTVIFGTGAMMHFERQYEKKLADRPGEMKTKSPDAGGHERFDFENSFWFSVYSLFAGEPTPITPKSPAGKVVVVFIMFMGLTIFAMFTGTVSAFMVERFRMEGRAMDIDEVRDHIIICGWNVKAEIIVQEYRVLPSTKHIPIVVVAQFDSEQPAGADSLGENISFLNDDFTRITALEKAGVHRARTCIILADVSGGRSEQDADARTILTGLTVEKLNPDVYTCAELINRSYGMHLEMGHVDDYVVSGEYSAYMLAQAAMNRGLMEVFTELLTYQTEGNEFYRLKLPEQWNGRKFMELLVHLKENHNAILVAVCPQGAKMRVNPADHTFAENDEIVAIAEQEFKF